jgi:WD40 repeat protein
LPVRCARNDCWAQEQNKDEHPKVALKDVRHGNIRLAYTDGRRERITTKGTAVGNEGFDDYNENGPPATSNPQLSPDGETVGWTRGEHQKCEDWSIGGTMFVNAKLVLFRRGKVLRIFQTPGTFITGWRFWNNGKYVAMGSRWHHGMGYVRLFDVQSGKLLERLSTPDADAKKIKWAANLTP